MTSANEILTQRLDGTFEVDPWGFDPELNRARTWLALRRWRFSIAHGNRLPKTGPALLVVNQRFGISEMSVLIAAIEKETGRHIRVADLVDVPFVANVQRRFGSVLARPNEVDGVLRAGHMVALPLSRRPLRRHAVGSVDAEVLASAARSGLPIIPIGVRGHELGRHWHVTVGRSLRAKLTLDPSSTSALVDRARAAVKDLV